MRKCKGGVVSLIVLCSLFVVMTAQAASTSASVSITKNDDSVSSSSVGVSKSARYYASNYSTSTGNMTMNAYACWTGWPYSRESSVDISPTGTYSYTESQDKNSSFYIELYGSKLCKGYGSVRVN